MGHSKVLPPDTTDKKLVAYILLHLTYRLTRRMRLLDITSKNVRIYMFTKFDVIKYTYTFDRSNNCNHEFVIKVRKHIKLWKWQPLFQIGIKCQELIYDDSKYLIIDKTMDSINKKFGANAGNDVANILKRALSRGEFRTVAATTWKEYK